MDTEPGCVRSASTQEAARFTIGALTYRVLSVDDVLPRHTAARTGGRTRLVYVEGELAHFQLGDHRFSLVPERAAEMARPAAAGPGVPDDIHDLLTNRELQIVQLICMGCLTKQVADRLRISEFTVRSYLKTVYCKLGVRSRGAMVYRYAQAFQRLPAA
jgi:DNA-binding NarL/FixJ family response regulator